MTENTKRPRYQLYQPKLEETVTVELHIGECSNIPCSLYKLYSRYSVTVSYNGPERKQEHLTSKKMAWWAPNWKEKFTFRIIGNRESNKYLDSNFGFTLKAIPCLGPAYKVATGTSTLDNITKKNGILELTGGIKIAVRWETLDTKPDVRIRDQDKLCDEEEVFCTRRKNKIKKSKVFKELLGDDRLKNIKLEDAQIPIIAVIGSGGGMRAVGGMSGAMTALQDSQILDVVMYTAGVSGSSWYISTLYTSVKRKLWPSDVRKSIKKRLNGVWQEVEALTRSLIITGLRQFLHTGKYRTLTNVFGNVIGDILLKKKKDLTWSSQTTRLEKADVPLPLLAMLHVHDRENPGDVNEWVECSPYEAFMPKYGVGIDMKHFGSEFDGGFIKKKYPEEPVHFLQGICGSAFISVLSPKPDRGYKCCSRNYQLTSVLQSYLMETMEGKCVGEIPNWLYNISAITPLHEEKYIPTEDDLGGVITSMKKVIRYISRTDISEVDKCSMEKVIKVFSDTKDLDSPLERRDEVCKQILEDDIISMKKILTEFSRDQISEVDSNNMEKVVNEISNVINSNSTKKVLDIKSEAIMLTDAGIAFNSPYPLVLHPAKKIDLILSFEFSAPDDTKLSDWPFSELQKAKTWADYRNIPFPDLKDIEEYKTGGIQDLYVFEGTTSPTIMHFVLYKEKVNETRKDSELEVKEMFKKYDTFIFKYSNEDFDWLSRLMSNIVEKNIKKIKTHITEAIEKCNRKQPEMKNDQ